MIQALSLGLSANPQISAPGLVILPLAKLGSSLGNLPEAFAGPKGHPARSCRSPRPPKDNPTGMRSAGGVSVVHSSTETKEQG